jgi:hypothetical protein
MARKYNGGIRYDDHTNPDADPMAALRPAGALAETFPRANTGVANAAAISTQTLFLVAIPLRIGMTVTSISFVSGTQAASGPTNWWFALYDSARALLGQTADQTTTAWAATTFKTVALSSPYPVTASGLFYLGIMMKATTPVSLLVSATNVTIPTPAPILNGTSTGTLTTTAPNPAAAITATANRPYAYVS